MSLSLGIGVGLTSRRGSAAEEQEAPSRFDITTVSDLAGEPLVTTAAAHLLSTGSDVTIAGNDYAGDYEDITVISPTTFVLEGETYVADDTGGTWAGYTPPGADTEGEPMGLLLALTYAA
jgi:hypothetical protein